MGLKSVRSPADRMYCLVPSCAFAGVGCKTEANDHDKCKTCQHEVVRHSGHVIVVGPLEL